MIEISERKWLAYLILIVLSIQFLQVKARQMPRTGHRHILSYPTQTIINDFLIS